MTKIILTLLSVVIVIVVALYGVSLIATPMTFWIITGVAVSIFGLLVWFILNNINII